MGIFRLFEVLWVSSGFQELPGVSKENEMRLQCSSQCLFFRSAEQERGPALLLAALLIDQPATNHLAEAKAGHCDIYLRYRRQPRISIRGSGRVRACVVVGFVSLTPSVLPPAAGTPPASCCHLKTQTPKKRGKK